MKKHYIKTWKIFREHIMNMLLPADGRAWRCRANGCCSPLTPPPPPTPPRRSPAPAPAPATATPCSASPTPRLSKRWGITFCYIYLLWKFFSAFFFFHFCYWWIIGWLDVSKSCFFEGGGFKLIYFDNVDINNFFCRIEKKNLILCIRVVIPIGRAVYSWN